MFTSWMVPTGVAAGEHRLEQYNENASGGWLITVGIVSRSVGLQDCVKDTRAGEMAEYKKSIWTLEKQNKVQLLLLPMEPTAVFRCT